MLIRDARTDDWPQIWPFLRQIVAAGETFTWDQDIDEARARAQWMHEPPGCNLVAADEDGYRAMQFNAVVETNTRAVALWRSLGFEVLTTVPEAFHHPAHSYVGLLVMYRGL